MEEMLLMKLTGVYIQTAFLSSFYFSVCTYVGDYFVKTIASYTCDPDSTWLHLPPLHHCSTHNYSEEPQPFQVLLL